MIAWLKGILRSRQPDRVVLEVSGVGFSVAVPLSTYESLPQQGHDAFLHTYMSVKEDDISLYGFATEDEKLLFSRLIGISGVGPRTALAVLSAIPAAEFVQVIEHGDVPRLQTVKGLGKKTAQRMILELKGKLDLDLPQSGNLPSFGNDAVEALVTLGYPASEARRAIGMATEKLGTSCKIEDIIREALRSGK